MFADSSQTSPRLNLPRWLVSVRMGITIALLLIILTTGWFVFQHFQAREKGSDGPIVCREAIWEFGELAQEKPERLHHVYKLENRSGETIRIEKVAPDCGCVVADKPPREIGPASAAELAVDVNGTGVPGPFHKTVQVILGTTPVSKLTLTIRGTILPCPALCLAPLQCDFGTLDEEETRLRSVRVARYDGSAVRFQQARSESEALQVKEVVSGNRADSFVELKLAIDASLLKAGNFRSSVVVITEKPEYREVTIPVLAKIDARPNGLVTSMFIDRLARGTFQEQPLVSGTGPHPRVEKVDYEGDGPITATWIGSENQNSSGGKPVVRISWPEGTVKQGICGGSLVVRLAGAKKPVRIPLTVLLSE
jgi:Protein of unknown function (DUF1573)